MIYGVELQKEHECFTFWGSELRELFNSKSGGKFKPYIITITFNDDREKEMEVEICDLDIITNEPTHKWLIFHSEKTKETFSVKTDEIKSVLFKEVI